LSADSSFVHLRVFTLQFDPGTQSFDDAQVREFLADKAVSAVRDHFFIQDGSPYLALVVTYHPHATPTPPVERAAGRVLAPAPGQGGLAAVQQPARVAQRAGQG
jgi:hypothetical protein